MSATRKLEASLARMASLNPTFCALATIDEPGARADAARVERAEAQGRSLGLLHGVTIAVKDNIDSAGLRTAAGSAWFADRVPVADAPVVERLRRAGAIVVGKASMMELAFGIRSFDQIGGQVRNPWNLERVPGGSSGGSAAAAALDFCDAALGSDTGGSVRVPAGFCGVTGLRPTHGLVPNRGSVPVSATFDTIGPMARSVEDVARVLAVIAGPDADDALSVESPLSLDLLKIEADVAGLRIGLPRRFYFDDIDAEVGAAVRGVADALAKAGAILVEIDIPGAEQAHSYATKMIYSDVCEVHADNLDRRPELMSRQVHERMIKGRDVSGVEYARAMRFREAWRLTLARVFGQVDVTLFPTSPHPAPPIVEDAHLEATTAHATRFTYGGALGGVPGLSLPCGLTKDGLPIGALFEAKRFGEATLFRVGRAWQAMSDWHLRRPPVQGGGTAPLRSTMRP